MTHDEPKPQPEWPVPATVHANDPGKCEQDRLEAERKKGTKKNRE